MANLNKVMLIGRLTREPEVRTFGTGGKVAKFGFAVNNRRRNAAGEWEDEPVFMDVDAFNRGEMGKLADRVEQSLHKGMQIFIEGHLKLEQWTSKEGEKRSKLSVVMDNFQYLEPRAEGSMPEGGRGSRSGGVPSRRPASSAPREGGGFGDDLEPPEGRDEEIPF